MDITERRSPRKSYSGGEGYPSIRSGGIKHHQGFYDERITFRKRETKESNWTDEMPAELGP
jgi:hypothetical protein